MSDIQKDLDRIMKARYGRDVRQSIYDGILDCHEDANMAIEEAQRLSSSTESALEEVAAAIADANQAAEETRETATGLTQEVNTAIENSNTATNTATQAAQEAQNAAQEAREAAENIGTKAGVGSIKGNAETEYRSGEKINLTPEDLGALSTIGDVGNNTVTFTSNDSGPDGDHAVLEVEKLTTRETLSSILQKVSRMFTNIRYVLNLLGTTDISSAESKIGDGTVTSAISVLDSSKQSVITGAATTIASSDLTVSRALVSNAEGKVAVSATTSTELEYVHGVTSAIQTQLNNKMANTKTNTNIIGADGTTLYGSCPIFKIGNVVHLNVALRLTTDKAANATVFQIPSGWRPGYVIENVACVVILPDNTINVGAFTIGTNGTIKIVSGLNASTRLFVNITYYSA